MHPLVILLVLLMVIGLFGGISGAVAQSRGHNFWLFFAIGVFISPVLAIILALVISSPAPQGRRRVTRRGVKLPAKRSTERVTRGSVGKPEARPARSYRR